MKKFLTSLSSKFSSLIRRNGFLKIISVILAVFAWFAIIYYANPTNSAEFRNVPIKIHYEGSVPGNNGLMMLLTDTNFTCEVKVQGGRTALLVLNADDISATLNFDSIASAGIYEVPVNVSVLNSDVTCTSVSPSSIKIEFVKTATKTLDVGVKYENSLADGYEAVEENITPKKVTVTGPAEIVRTIASASTTVDLALSNTDINTQSAISLFDKDGNLVEMKYLTLDVNEIQTKLKVVYRRTLPLTVDVVNIYGGDESSYANIICDPATVTVQGDEETLDALGDRISLGQFDVSELGTGSRTIEMIYPTIDGVTFVAPDNSVSVTVQLNGAHTKTLVLTQSEMNDLFTYTQTPNGATAHVTSQKLNVKVRSNKINDITINSLHYSINFNEKNERGQYRVVITNKSGVPVGILDKYYVSVELQ